MQMPMLFQWLVPHWWKSETPKAPDEESALSKAMNTSVGKAPGSTRCVCVVEFFPSVSWDDMQQLMFDFGLDDRNATMVDNTLFYRVEPGEKLEIQF